MKYTKYDLQITIDELERLLERAKNEAQYNNMESCIYIQGGEKPTIKSPQRRFFFSIVITHLN